MPHRSKIYSDSYTAQKRRLGQETSEWKSPCYFKSELNDQCAPLDCVEDSSSRIWPFDSSLPEVVAPEVG